jgi:ABC-type Fe3+-hydroxamate transport system substrate-binding protein
VWQALPAVQAGRVLLVDRNLWGGAGLMWANALLDDVDRLFPS